MTNTKLDYLVERLPPTERFSNADLAVNGGGPFCDIAIEVSGYKHLAILTAGYALGRGT